MHTWKVLVIGLLALICLALTMATILVGLDTKGSDRWLWMGGLLAGTIVAGGLFVLFLRYAGSSMDTKPGWTCR